MDDTRRYWTAFGPILFNASRQRYCSGRMIDKTRFLGPPLSEHYHRMNLAWKRGGGKKRRGVWF